MDNSTRQTVAYFPNKINDLRRGDYLLNANDNHYAAPPRHRLRWEFGFVVSIPPRKKERKLPRRTAKKLKKRPITSLLKYEIIQISGQ